MLTRFFLYYLFPVLAVVSFVLCLYKFVLEIRFYRRFGGALIWGEAVKDKSGTE